MEQYKQEFIEFMVDSNVLKFGDFTLKSGRKSPFFMNAGAYVTGTQLRRLGEYYAKAIHDNYGLDFDILFGPAYKGIPLAASVAMNLSRLGCDVPEVLGIVQLIEIAANDTPHLAGQLHGVGQHPVTGLLPVKLPCVVLRGALQVHITFPEAVRPGRAGHPRPYRWQRPTR